MRVMLKSRAARVASALSLLAALAATFGADSKWR